ncbi:restriction endonuclease [Soonwooa purpurea]
MIDFKEIPIANTNSGQQDTFELFARDFFSNLGYEIHTDPGRGSDNGRDLIINEKINSKFESNSKSRKWLVSCKHYAYSGKSVTAKDELDIIDRLKTNDCYGFIGFYSTLPNESLKNKLESVANYVYDYKKIENEIISNPNLLEIFKRYFPKSYRFFLTTTEVFAPTKIITEFFENIPEFQNTLLFNNTINSENIYKGLVIYDDFKKLINFLGYKINIVNYIDEYEKKLASILIINSFLKNDKDTNFKIENEFFTYNTINDRGEKKLVRIKIEDYKKIYSLEDINTFINYHENPAKFIAKKLKEIVIDDNFPNEIDIKSFSSKSPKLIYFITSENVIFMDKLNYRYNESVFNLAKDNYFR